MKNKAFYIILISALTFSFTGCEEYLEIPVEAGLTEDDIFSTYRDFQGFQDQLPVMMKDYTRGGARRVHSLGGEAVAYAGFSVTKANLGLYARSGGGLMQAHSIFFPHNEGSAHEGANFGLYSHMWKAVRIANICLAKLSEGNPVEATNEQRNWLKGQALFYRAFWHYEFVRIWGTIPYVDTVIPSGSEYDYMNRHWSYEKNGKTYNDCQAVFERVIDDMEEAATLLPTNWESPIINWGRPTKAAALGYVAKALHNAGSPLFNEYSTGVADYDDELLSRCIVACEAVIEEAKKIVAPPGMPAVNADGLSKMEDYQRLFVLREGGIQPGTPEVLWKKPNMAFGAVTVRQTAGRAYGDKNLTNQDGAQGNCQYADKFEMADGTRYRPEYDQDPAKRWVGRDPRFYKVFYVHGDSVGTAVVNQAWGVRAKEFNCFIVRKYFADGVNNPEYVGNGYATPYLRLADIYLTYAEAAYELLGDENAVPTGGTITAADAVNIVRSRAGMPDVASTLASGDYTYLMPESEETAYSGNADPFRILYRNERAVELAYEGSYWYDIRRWKIAHYKDGTPITILKFDLVGDNKDVANPIDDVSVERIKAPDSGNFVFKDAHYWMPFLDDDVFFAESWEQNPGW